MSFPKKHFRETKRLTKLVPTSKIAKWLLEEGYYPEQYVMPPPFQVKRLELQDAPYYEVDNTGPQPKFDPEKSEIVTVSFPKSELTDRTFGIMAPKLYHDIVWHLVQEWDLVTKTLFNNTNKIYSYSFPIPVSKKTKGSLGHLRAGRMIYEFLEMAEKDLVAEAYKYKYILKTDVKNFYPSIYTHSIAWALHSKELIRRKGNRTHYSTFLGLRLDRLFQAANDSCTNGIAIGPAISDLIGEIILSTIDTQCSKIISDKGIDFIGVRFKDDYRFLCQSKHDAKLVIKALQKQLSSFNLTLNEGKSDVAELPEGLFREWTADYQSFSLRYKKKISYKRFESSLRGTLKVDHKHPRTGVVDRFLSELVSKDNELKFEFKSKDLYKAISLLLLLKERRNKSFPQILGIIEKILEQKAQKPNTTQRIETIIHNLLDEKLKNIDDNEYDLIWLIYFIKSLGLFTISFPKKTKSPLITSLKANRSSFFSPLPKEIKIFDTIKSPGNNKKILEYLAMFKKVDE